MRGHGASLGLSLDLALKSGGLRLQYDKTDRAIDLGSLTAYTVPDLSGNANTATLNTGIYVSSNGSSDVLLTGVDLTAAGTITNVTFKAKAVAGVTLRITGGAGEDYTATQTVDGGWEEHTITTNGTFDNFRAGCNHAETQFTLASWSDIRVSTASGVVARYKLYDSAAASLDGYPALDCVGGFHGAHAGCAGGSGEADILQTAGEDFNFGAYSSWVDAFSNASNFATFSTAPFGFTATTVGGAGGAGFFLAQVVPVGQRVRVTGNCTTGQSPILRLIRASDGAQSSDFNTLTTGAFDITMTAARGIDADSILITEGDTPSTITIANFQVEYLDAELTRGEILIPESETTAGQDALGNAIVKMRPNDRTINLGATGAYVEIADADSLDLVNDFTFECWIDAYGAPALSSLLISKGSTFSLLGKLAVHAAGQLYVDYNAADWTSGSTQAGVVDGMMCFQSVYSSGYYNYFNTVAKAAIPSFNDDVPINTDPLIIRGADGMHVMVGDLRLYDSVLTTDQLTKNYQARKSAYGL